MEETPNQQVAPQPQPEIHPSSGMPRMAIIAGVVILMALIGVGGYVLGTKNSASKQEQVSQALPTTQPSPTTAQIVTPSTMQNPTTAPNNWLTYSGSSYSIKYPPTWTTKAESSDVESIYDSSTMQTKIQNGGGKMSVPTKYVNITIIASSETAKQYADKMTTNNPAYNGVNANRRTIVINGIQAETYMESGEGSMGYDVVIANGKQVVVLNIPVSDPSADPTVQQMLSTFKFK